MAIGDLDSGARFGLPPIGLPQAHLDTPGSDTERRAFPGLATKSSVFAWVGTPTQIVLRTTVTGVVSDTINLRNNTAPSGASMDVPTWAAGAIITIDFRAVTMGTSTYHSWGVSPAILALQTLFQVSVIRGAATLSLGNESVQSLIPFYDEPVLTISYITDGTGTSTYRAWCLGFVRNV